ncbi:MAG TPA: CBS domain-containing protein [Sedimentisphaerales bacterium]|nr:CBS domain-containing protein [Sedimentisphaerales bacterium]
MRVKDIMTCSAETINSDVNLIEAAGKMKSLEVGALPVWENDKLIGVVTDRDIVVRAIAEGRDALKTPVSEIMTQRVLSCFEDDDIHEAATIMEENSVHRLVVLDSDYKPAGFISLSDFAVKSHDEHLTYEVLERISEPACPHR